MNGRAVLFSATVCLIIAAGVDAQFIGDALAAAGVAATEQQAAAAVGSVRGASAPKTGSAHESSAPQGAKVYEASTVGTDVGLRRPQGTSGEAASTSGTMAVTGPSGSKATKSAPSQPQVGGSSGFAGAKLQAQTIDPEELSAWQAAMKPVGSKVASLPSTAVDVSQGGKTYKYDKGVFYEKQGAGLVAVPAPVGARVASKPLGAATVFAAGKPYIYYYGTFYLYDGAERAYVVVAPPAGALIDYLPDTAKKVEWKGATHYSYAGTYYKPYYRGSSLVFEVAGQG